MTTTIDQNVFRSISPSHMTQHQRLDDIENNVEASLKDLDIQNGLDPDVMKRFRNMNYMKFVQYLIEGGNHQAEIKHYLTKSMHPNYVNSVLLTLTEELWFKSDKLRQIREGPLRMFYPSR